MSSFLTYLLAGMLLVSTLAAARDEPAEPLSDEAIIERILDLQRQIDELVAALSPELRAELEKRLSERRAAASVPLPGAPPAEPAPPEPAAPEPAAPEPARAAAPTVGTPLSRSSAPRGTPAAAVPRQPPVRRRLARGPRCNFLAELDENQDGKISAQDRHWRHLYLWSDRNGDRQIQDKEVESAFARGVREIAVELETFVRRKGTLGEIRVDDAPVLDVKGDGFGGPDDGVLVVDATRLKRGSGPEFLSASGEPLEGFQPFREGVQIRSGDGRVTALGCP